MSLPRPDRALPENTPRAIGRFWARYWVTFLAFIPFLFVRQLVLSVHTGLAALATWNGEHRLLGGRLRLLYVNSWRSLGASALFGERFLVPRQDGVLIDPGPPFARGSIERWIEGEGVECLAITHHHEEHLGNARAVVAKTKAPIYASDVTLAHLEEPERLSPARRWLIGEADALEAPVTLDEATFRARTGLETIASSGHCDGHVSFYDPETRVLFAGDSFLHEIFTAPNKDVDAAEWIATLERYAELDVSIMIGSHGYVTTLREDVPAIPFVVERKDPNALIRGKLAFLRWASDVVAEGERRGLPYAVIEASLFPWSQGFTWRNWFIDELSRLLSCGEFSRTWFVRSLSRTPERVPARFGLLSQLAAAIVPPSGRAPAPDACILGTWGSAEPFSRASSSRASV